MRDSPARDGFTDWEGLDALPEPVRRVLAAAGMPYDVDANLRTTVDRARAAGMTDAEIAQRLAKALSRPVERWRRPAPPHGA